MKTLIILICMILISSCGRHKGTPLREEAQNNIALQEMLALTDMTYTGSNKTFFLSANGASYNQPVPGVYELTSGPGVNDFEGQLNGSNGPSGNARLGGKAFLGFPVEAANKVITNTSELSFNNQRLSGSSQQLYVNLVVDSDCDGVFNSSTDAILGFGVDQDTAFTLSQSSPIVGIYGGTIAGVSVGHQLSDLVGKCLINTQLSDNGMPAGKKMAGILIVVGDSSKNLTSDLTFEISNIDIRF